MSKFIRENADLMFLNNYQIKLLAAILMVIDHVGAVFLPDVMALRVVGRLSFPLFVWLLVEGERHTRNFEQYCVRLLLLGIISQPIYQILFASTRWNILFMLLLGLVCLRLVRVFPQWQLLIWLLGATIAQFSPVEYQGYGVLAIAIISNFKSSLLSWVGWIGLHLGLLIFDPGFGLFQLPAIASLLIFQLADRHQGRKARWFYLFYPTHLVILWLIREGGISF
jgi:TraX protein